VSIKHLKAPLLKQLEYSDKFEANLKRLGPEILTKAPKDNYVSSLVVGSTIG